MDMSGWLDEYGDDCTWYEQNDNPGCPNYGNDYAPPSGPFTDVTPNQACCHCQV